MSPNSPYEKRVIQQQQEQDIIGFNQELLNILWCNSKKTLKILNLIQSSKKDVRFIF